MRVAGVKGSGALAAGVATAAGGAGLYEMGRYHLAHRKPKLPKPQAPTIAKARIPPIKIMPSQLGAKLQAMAPKVKPLSSKQKALAGGTAAAITGPLAVAAGTDEYNRRRFGKGERDSLADAFRNGSSINTEQGNPPTHHRRRRMVHKAQHETRTQAFQRHQRQVAGLLTGSAAIPAILALRSGRAASVAGFSGHAEQQATHSIRQLRHAATGTALTGLAGATMAAPTPHRKFTAPNPKRNKKPSSLGPAHHKYRASGHVPSQFTSSTIGKGTTVDTLDAFGVDRPDLFSKRFVSQKERENLQEKGHAMAPLKGSTKPRYPIKNLADLKNAKKAIGRVKPGKRASTVAHINEEAKRLGAPKLGETSKSDINSQGWAAVTPPFSFR
jgi:hypothetical protein